MAAATEVVKQALVVYSFAPIYDGTPEEGGWAYLRAQWRACAALGMTEPLDGTGTPVTFPTTHRKLGRFACWRMPGTHRSPCCTRRSCSPTMTP